MRVPQNHVSRLVMGDCKVPTVPRPIQMGAVTFQLNFFEQVSVPFPDVYDLIVACSGKVITLFPLPLELHFAVPMQLAFNSEDSLFWGLHKKMCGVIGGC